MALRTARLDRFRFAKVVDEARGEDAYQRAPREALDGENSATAVRRVPVGSAKTTMPRSDTMTPMTFPGATEQTKRKSGASCGDGGLSR